MQLFLARLHLPNDIEIVVGSLLAPRFFSPGTRVFLPP